jgi:hypothetical protein
MRAVRLWLPVKVVIFLLLIPGTVVVYIPRTILFYGGGTPSPVDPPKALVVVIAVIASEAALFRSPFR